MSFSRWLSGPMTGEALSAEVIELPRASAGGHDHAAVSEATRAEPAGAARVGQAARSIVVVEDGIDVEDWSHPDLEYARRWRPRIATVRRAYGEWGRLLGRRDTRRDQNVRLLVRAGK